MKRIASIENPLVKRIVKLRDNARFRNSERLVFLEGKKVIKEVLKIQEATYILSTSQQPQTLFSIPPSAKTEIFNVTDSVLKKLSNQMTPEDTVAVFPFPKWMTDSRKGLNHSNLVLCLNEIQDPSNVGSLFRTAFALGWNDIFLMSGCCDPFNAKAIQAARGATFFTPFQTGSWEKLQKVVNKNRLIPVVADMKGMSIHDFTRKHRKELTNGSGILLILNNEGHGSSSNVQLTPSPEQVTIKMENDQLMDSMNVNAAGAILMHNIRDSLQQIVQSNHNK